MRDPSTAFNAVPGPRCRGVTGMTFTGVFPRPFFTAVPLYKIKGTNGYSGKICTHGGTGQTPE
jgi:hypothetical protein